MFTHNIALIKFIFYLFCLPPLWTTIYFLCLRCRARSMRWYACSTASSRSWSPYEQNWMPNVTPTFWLAPSSSTWRVWRDCWRARWRERWANTQRRRVSFVVCIQTGHTTLVAITGTAELVLVPFCEVTGFGSISVTHRFNLCPAKCVMKWLIYSQTSMAAPLKFGNR